MQSSLYLNTRRSLPLSNDRTSSSWRQSIFIKSFILLVLDYLLSFQIQNLQKSINSLQEKMRPIEDYFSAPLNLIFLSSAPISIDKIDPLELPNLPLALDMYILKDQTLVLTSTWVEDITITLDFQHCKTKLHERFSQQISLYQQPFY